MFLNKSIIHTSDFHERQWDIPNGLLMSTIVGKKYIQGNFSKIDDNNGIKTNFPNIGEIKLYKKSNQNIYELLNLLTLRWNYMLNKNEPLNLPLMRRRKELFYEK